MYTLLGCFLSGIWDDSIIFHISLILATILAHLKSINYQTDWLDISPNFCKLSVTLIHTESKK